MIPFRKSIGFRILGISFILLALPLLVDAFILAEQRYEETLTDAKGHLVEVAYSRELPLTQIQPLKKPLLEVMSFYLNLENSFPEKPDTELNEKLRTLANIGNFSEIFLIKITDDDHFVVTASSLPKFIGRDYTDFFRLNNLLQTDILKKSGFIAYNNKISDPFFIVSHLVYSEKGDKPIGVLAISDNLTYKLSDLLEKDEDRFEVSFALLLPSSVVFASSDPQMRFEYFKSLTSEYRKLFAQEEPFAGRELPNEPLKVDDSIGNPFFEFKWKGKEQIGYITDLPHANFSLLTYASKEAIFRAPVTNFFKIYGIYALILLVGGIIAYVLTRRMAKPMQFLSRVMQKIQQGDLGVRYKQDALGFEINVLGDIFNEMVDAVLEQKKVAEEERVTRETLARELRLGQQVQRSLLPQKMPKYPGVDLAEMYIPAIEVGGDFYDVFVKERENAPDQLALAVADASGKGVQACFYSLSVRNMLRTYARVYDDVGMAMSATNNLFGLETGESGMFVTVVMGVYDHKTGMFQYFSSGHNSPIVRRENGKIEVLRQHGIAMGVISTEDQHAETIKLMKGDAVILYTDGITEAHNEEFEIYGEERLIELIREEGSRGASEIREKILRDVDTFVGTAPQHDDITLLVMKIC